MGKHRAIPPGYMTVGEIAKKMDVTVRTLQYYDKKGLLSPSSESEGGRRLYTHKDIVKLHQIQSMKYLGFSLEDIKTRLPSIDTPEEVSDLLTKQAIGIREKVKSLMDVLASIEKLTAEVSQMETVNWVAYADITTALQIKSDSYWMIKHFDETMRNNFQRQNDFDKEVLNLLETLMKRAAELQKNGLSPESESSQAFAKDWWDFVMDITGGNTSLLPKLFEFGAGLSDNEWKDNHAFDKDFLGKALAVYLENIGFNIPLKENEKI